MRTRCTLLLCVAVVVPKALGWAQGTVSFNNDSTSLVQMQGWWEASPTPVPKGGGYVQLAYAPSGTAFTPWAWTSASAWLEANAGWTLGSVTPIGPVAGRFNGGVVTLNGIPARGTVDCAILAWTGSMSSFDSAYASGMGLIGISERFTVATGGGSWGDPPALPPSLASTFPGYTLQYIPEPTVFSLAALGALMFWLRRGRR